MKKSIIKIISLFLCMVLFLSGCSLSGGTKTEINYPKGKEAQAVVAFNPIFYLDGESVAAFNDINAAITNDVKAKTLTSLSDDTSWKWVSKSGGSWKLRATHALDAWRNRGSVADGKLKAYSFSNDGTVALMCYAASQFDVQSYNGDSFPDMGVLMSTSGDRQENLSYVVESDSYLEIPAGTLTMIKSVGGVETGFLDSDDGSDRTAVVNIMVNNTVLWSGEFGNGVGENGETVTFLEYPAFYDLPVLSGDVISFGIQLNGKKAEKLYDGQDTESAVEDEDVTDIPVIEEEEAVIENTVSELSFVDGYNSRFELVYPENATISQQKLANSLYTKIEAVTGAEVKFKTDNTTENPVAEYEILVGETNRSASKEAYSQIRGYRKNCANDYIVTVSGKSVVIAAVSDVALEEAINFFTTTYLKDDKSTVPTDMYHVSRPKVRSFTIGGVNATNFVIRTEKYPSILAKRAATDLSNFFVTEGGIVVPVENDQKTTANEILVGFTERSGISSTVFKEQSLDYINGYDAEQYSVYFKDGRLYVDAGSDYAANYAVGLIINSLKTSNNIPTNYKKFGNYSTAEESTKYTLSDGYGLAWNDEFLTEAKDGTPIENKLLYWKDNAAQGSDGATQVHYPPSSKLVQDLLKLDLTDPLRKLMGNKAIDGTYGAYYPFGKVYQPGRDRAYGVENNMLYQTTKFDTSTGFWTSRLDSKGQMDFRYGIFEVRAIVGVKDGVSSALWFGGASGLEDGVEIDIFENFGRESLKPNLHTWANYKTNHINHGSSGDFTPIRVYPPEGEHLYDTFHYIGMEWSADYIDFYFDGEIFCSVPMTDEKWNAFEQKVFPYITYGVYGGFYQFETYYPGNNGGIEELLNFEVTQYYDYVRIFQKNGERHRVWDYVAD